MRIFNSVHQHPLTFKQIIVDDEDNPPVNQLHHATHRSVTTTTGTQKHSRMVSLQVR